MLGAAPGGDEPPYRRLPPPHRLPAHVVAVAGESEDVGRVVGADAVGGACVGGVTMGVGGGNAAVAVVLTGAAGASAEGAAVPGS